MGQSLWKGSGHGRLCLSGIACAFLAYVWQFAISE
jgi:hypothetical protein